MEAPQIQQLINDSPEQKIDCTETHISYVLQSKAFAYKIKKSVKLSFLDFSSLPARKYYCEEELRLNRRLAEDTYLAVVPIFDTGKKLILDGGGQGGIIDYAVKMKRLDNALEMDKLLDRQQVTTAQIDSLAKTIASFHARTEIINKEPEVSELKKTFNAIEEHIGFIEEHISAAYAQLIHQAMQCSDQFLDANIITLKKRSQQGLVRDVHGDLHSKNIFLYDQPVIFDCIEFDPVLRQIDLLNEIAFLCMDLESRNAKELGNYFYQCYINLIVNENIGEVEDKGLFNYFKLYRANVRAKVASIDAEAHLSSDEFEVKKQEVTTYLKLIKEYMNLLDV